MSGVARLVLDASVYVASRSPAESHHRRARELMTLGGSATPFLVPDLFRLEVVAALARRGASVAALDAVEEDLAGIVFEPRGVTRELIDGANQVARRAHLRAYDAVYVALALQEHAHLVTLDVELLQRVRENWPRLLRD